MKSWYTQYHLLLLLPADGEGRLAKKTHTKLRFSDLQALLLQLVVKAGRLLRSRINAEHRIVFKSEIDIVTEMDHMVEDMFLRAIKKKYPDHQILSEEMITGAGRDCPRTCAPQGTVRWIIDPLDGTTNYAHGFPHFGVSAGVEYLGEIVLGAVFNPMLRELFFAQKGKGAWLNGKRIRVSGLKHFRQALLATGFPYDLKTSKINNFAEFKYISEHCQAVRRAGSASLDLCDVACGRFDGFWEYKLKPWDVAAASLIIVEAGGKITNFSGRALSIYNGSFVAGNRELHATLARAVRAGSKRK
ncbi:inositol monophosphatase [bacterium]|nr:inositol monophosphatase [bacterium]